MGKERNGFAVMASIIGLLSLVVPLIGIVLGIIALVLGIFALREEHNSYRDKFLSVMGIALGSLTVVVLILSAVFTRPEPHFMIIDDEILDVVVDYIE